MVLAGGRSLRPRPVRSEPPRRAPDPAAKGLLVKAADRCCRPSQALLGWRLSGRRYLGAWIPRRSLPGGRQLCGPATAGAAPLHRVPPGERGKPACGPSPERRRPPGRGLSGQPGPGLPRPFRPPSPRPGRAANGGPDPAGNRAWISRPAPSGRPRRAPGPLPAAPPRPQGASPSQGLSCQVSSGALLRLRAMTPRTWLGERCRRWS